MPRYPVSTNRYLDQFTIFHLVWMSLSLILFPITISRKRIARKKIRTYRPWLKPVGKTAPCNTRIKPRFDSSLLLSPSSALYFSSRASCVIPFSFRISGLFLTRRKTLISIDSSIHWLWNRLRKMCLCEETTLKHGIRSDPFSVRSVPASVYPQWTSKTLTAITISKPLVHSNSKYLRQGLRTQIKGYKMIFSSQMSNVKCDKLVDGYMLIWNLLNLNGWILYCARVIPIRRCDDDGPTSTLGYRRERFDSLIRRWKSCLFWLTCIESPRASL